MANAVHPLVLVVLWTLSYHGTNGLTGCWHIATRYKFVTRYGCCAGWTESNGCCCNAICYPGCKNGGTCVQPYRCKCSTGWTGSDCSQPVCMPKCEHNGTCIRPNNTCRCVEGYNGPRCHSPICKTACFNKGTCIAPEKCECDKHWTDNHCTTPVCNPPCSKGGVCINPNECRYSENVAGTKACHGKKLDVSFVLDTSGSIGVDNFQRMKNFIRTVVNEMDISSSLTRVSLIEFGSNSSLKFQLGDHLNITELVNAIENTTFSGGSTSTSDALEMMRKKGFIGERPTAPDVGIIITDGLSKYPYLTRAQAELAKQNGITLVAIGIGSDASHTELFGIASGQTRLFEVADFKKLLAIAEDVARTVCEVEPDSYAQRTTTPLPTTVDGCVDNRNCSLYARDMCYDYEAWARIHCPKTCGFCGNANTNMTTALECKNNIDICAQYGKYMCTDEIYYNWVLKNCAEYCGYCGNKTDATVPPEIEMATTKAPKVCKDHLDNCDEYGGPSVCQDMSYKGWTRDNCPKYCGQCYTLRRYDAVDVGSMSCPRWDLPEECTLEDKGTSCCPIPSCPPNLRLTVKRQ